MTDGVVSFTRGHIGRIAGGIAAALGLHDQNAPYQALQAKIDCTLLALGAVIKL